MLFASLLLYSHEGALEAMCGQLRERGRACRLACCAPDMNSSSAPRSPVLAYAYTSSVSTCCPRPRVLAQAPINTFYALSAGCPKARGSRYAGEQHWTPACHQKAALLLDGVAAQAICHVRLTTTCATAQG